MAEGGVTAQDSGPDAPEDRGQDAPEDGEQDAPEHQVSGSEQTPAEDALPEGTPEAPPKPPRVLIAVITWEGQRYCREYFFKFLNALKYPHLDFVFVTNSGKTDKDDLEEHGKLLSLHGKHYDIVLNNEEATHKFDFLVGNRNIARNYFLKGNWEWLLFLDSDIIGPRNMVEVMLHDKKTLVTGVYFGVFEHRKGKPQVLPVLYGFDKPGHARQLSLADVLQPRILPIAAGGLGCCLIKRHILEKITFSRNEETGSTEDAIFFLEARNKLKEYLWADTRILCWHMKFPPGDKRNNILDPRRYRLGDTRKRQ